MPHQANQRIVQTQAEKLHLLMEKVVLTVNHHGNTSAAAAVQVNGRIGRVRPTGVGQRSVNRRRSPSIRRPSGCCLGS
ncbi:3-oxoacyl-[acyl-carrier-protein] synthase III C-terminal domain-containing protein [Burkholderia sp. WSM2232]|uniref:3-oxoacyl-[acyl-carrier-protein] synthase III C-terminal domain-containing protein n=1 Tax=Burkholderia sp. WSM2232 TaxID=944436 RepID=UPI001E2EBC18|nr:3-oxoacyl-[acyl-carrier-protein] synthase III C-terminal domain-containing protein [Burkholderia sp. WSM2232]